MQAAKKAETTVGAASCQAKLSHQRCSHAPTPSPSSPLTTPSAPSAASPPPPTTRPPSCSTALLNATAPAALLGLVCAQLLRSEAQIRQQRMQLRLQKKLLQQKQSQNSSDVDSLQLQAADALEVCAPFFTISSCKTCSGLLISHEYHPQGLLAVTGMIWQWPMGFFSSVVHRTSQVHVFFQF